MHDWDRTYEARASQDANKVRERASVGKKPKILCHASQSDERICGADPTTEQTYLELLPFPHVSHHRHICLCRFERGITKRYHFDAAHDGW